MIYRTRMSIGRLLEHGLARWRKWRRERLPGPLGQWHRENGELRLSEDLPVRSNDIVVDAGGYQGEWAAMMAWRYGCRVLVVEPVSGFFQKIERRFACNDRIQVLNAALSNSEGTVRIAVDADGSSAYGTSAQVETVCTVDVVDLLAGIGVDKIACLKINIEGAEYDVLDRLAAADKLGTIRSYLIQFHRGAPEYDGRRARIRALLAKTHRLALDYAYVWERWESNL